MSRPKSGKSPWVTTPEILNYLNCSRSHLYKMRDEQLKKGHHYRDIRSSNSIKACYRWHIRRIEQLLEQ